MGKIRVTVSLDEEVVKKAKAKLAREGGNLSQLVEALLAMSDPLHVVDSLIEGLRLDKRIYSNQEIVVDRPEGYDAGTIVREIRDEREKNILGY